MVDVDHDILIDRLKQKVPDPGVIRLIRAYLNAGVCDEGVVSHRRAGTPQGGPLSPLLANVLLDEVPTNRRSRQRSSLLTGSVQTWRSAGLVR